MINSQLLQKFHSGIISLCCGLTISVGTAMEPESTNFEVPPQPPLPFQVLPKEAFHMIVDQVHTEFWTQTRAQFFSTCRALNQYGLQVYYPNLYPELKELNWHKLHFSSPYEKIRFNKLVLVSMDIFPRCQSIIDDIYNMNFNLEKKTNFCKQIIESPFPHFYTEYVNHLYPDSDAPMWKRRLHSERLQELIPTLEIQDISLLLEKFGINDTSFYFLKSLHDLSKDIIQKATRARICYEKNNTSGVFKSLTGLNWFVEGGKQPLFYLFQWFQEFTKGNVEDKYHYLAYYQLELHDITMTTKATILLKNYCFEINSILCDKSQIYAAEIGLYGYFFKQWNPVSRDCNNDEEIRTLRENNNYKCLICPYYIPPNCISQYSVIGGQLPKDMKKKITCYYNIEIPHIPEKSLSSISHPVFNKLIEAVNKMESKKQ